ncbi:MAG: hypothetical protein U9Q22_06525 [Candidatus Altiarchaeota archaeon]|nr:hypothetical protein [Candidatus Altiarchaeota archaeon]
MVSITFSLDDRLFSVIKRFPWVNWSEVARAEAMKREIFDRFIKGKMSAKDEEFCEKTRWDPLDEMEVREEYIEKLKRIEKGPHIPMTLEELDKLMGLNEG